MKNGGEMNNKLRHKQVFDLDKQIHTPILHVPPMLFN